MKFQGKYRVACQCKMCIGTGSSKRIKKAIKHKGRQEDRLQEKEAKLLTLVKNKYEKNV